MTRSGESEQRVAEALRARATGAGRGAGSRPAPRAGSAPRGGAPRASGLDVRTVLLLALLAGIALGAVLGLLSLVLPGL